MASPTPKLMAEPEGDSPELIAWGLTEWIRHVEQIADRNGILGAFSDSLGATGTVAADGVAGWGAAATGMHRRLAYKLTRLVAEMEGRDLGQRNQGDRAWILDTYKECLKAVMGERQAADVATAV